MFRTLYARLAVVLILLLAAIGLLYTFLSTSATRLYLQELNQRFNRDLARDLVADRNLVAEGKLDKEALKETFHQYMVINPSIEIYLLDLEGTLLSYSADPGKVKRKHVSLAPIEAFLRDDGELPLLGDDPRSHDRRKAFSVTIVPSAENPQGYLYVVLRGEEFDSAEQIIWESYFVRMSGLAVAGSLIFGLLAGLLIFRLLTRRLQHLSVMMAGFQKSNFTAHLPYSRKKPATADEIDRLGLTFDHMAEKISHQIDQLKEKDAQRRELVAQVSHDLRTPLASIQGYLESLQLKEKELSAEERAKYIAIILRQSRQLTHLVSELFELAKLDARETQPHCEAFSLAELVQDVIQKVSLKASEKGVRLLLDTTRSTPFVSADIALIERVLDNLIENALNHSDEGGRVLISLNQRGGNAIVSVKDRGSGISSSDLPYIFDPFFQCGSRVDTGNHAGLGLAIAKRIIDLHNGKISVSSDPDRGTLFCFSLPIAVLSA
ncbi:MAG: HAMP domain-containing histidine kinase [bacterium]|nr:HAMP domain-containing histidine kinase [bacterium]